MKKILYIGLFTLLGIAAQFIVHTVIEMWYIDLLIKDFAAYGLGLSWNTWFTIHHAGSVLLLILGMAAGYFQGKYWWKRIYNSPNPSQKQ